MYDSCELGNKKYRFSYEDLKSILFPSKKKQVPVVHESCEMELGLELPEFYNGVCTLI